MPQRVEAIVEPELLVWARERSGYDVETAARKATLSAERLAAWEAGEARPSVKQLRKLAHVYGRRIALFYLSEPPADFPPIKDYRRAWGEEHQAPSPDLRREIELAHERRSVALELIEDEGREPPVFGLRASIDQDPDEVASRVRQQLGIRLEDQYEWADARSAFNAWRFAIEALGALVLQMTEVATREARGFSIAETRLPVVVANNRDPFTARSFSLIHELVHVAIGQSGLCDLAGHRGVEPFCNHVAGAVLVPAEALLQEPIAQQHGPSPEWQDSELLRLAHAYRVSREVVLRRLLILGRTNETFYNQKRHELLEEYTRREAEPRTTGPVPPSTKAVIRAGHYFSQLVLSSYSHGLITGSDVADYLGVRLKHVPRIEQLVSGRQG